MKVRYALQRTINLGNFENVKIDIGIETACEENNVGKTFTKIKKFVENKIEEEMEEWQQK
jgi:hypothetical protein